MKKQHGLFYGWYLLGIAFLTIIVVYGVRLSFPVFYVAILDEFGWSRADTALIFSISAAVYGLVGLISGALADRFGPRKLIPLAAILLAAGTAACSLANEMWHFYVLFGIVVAVSSSGAGYVPLSVVLTNWFVRHRGAAFGVSSAGFGFCFFLASVVRLLILNIGWRNSFLVLGSLPLLIVAPLNLIFMRHRPADKGLLPDGAEVAMTTSDAPETDALVVDRKWTSTEWTVPKAIRTYRFWAVFFATFLLWGVAASTLSTHMVAFLEDVGFAPVFAAVVYGLYGLMVAGGNLLGFISDRLGRELTFGIGTIGAVLGAGVLLLVRDASVLWLPYLFAVAYGLCAGLNSPTLAAVTADLFQGRNFGKINGLMMLGFGMGGFVGPWLGGYIYDVLHNYYPAFVLVMIALAVCCLCVWISAPRKIRLVVGKAPGRRQVSKTA